MQTTGTMKAQLLNVALHGSFQSHTSNKRTIEALERRGLFAWTGNGPALTDAGKAVVRDDSGLLPAFRAELVEKGLL